MRANKMCIVVPCYNEEQVLEAINGELQKIIHGLVEDRLIDSESAILYVDDGSKDKTWSIIQGLNSANSKSMGLKLSKNVGHQNALLAGLMVAKQAYDITVSIDADLQDDVKIIRDFVNNYLAGDEIVYGVRKQRELDTFFKRSTAQLFYKFMHFMGVDVVYNHADYRLMSKLALEKLAEFKEVNLFLRGIIPLLGYKTSIVYYDRLERYAGESKYPFKKMLNFAFTAITSFSIKPIRMISMSGLIISLFGLIYLIYTLFEKIKGKTVPGWTSIIASVWLLGGMQLLSIGLIGEYIGNIYKEVKQRPKYIIELFIGK